METSPSQKATLRLFALARTACADATFVLSADAEMETLTNDKRTMQIGKRNMRFAIFNS
jgi:hypothetical protein